MELSRAARLPVHAKAHLRTELGGENSETQTSAPVKKQTPKAAKTKAAASANERMSVVRSTKQFVNSIVTGLLGMVLGMVLLAEPPGPGMGSGIMSPPPNVRPPGLKNVAFSRT